MGRLAKILSFVRAERRGAKVSDVKADPGGGPNITAEHFAPTGEDAHPLPGDYVATSRAAGTGRETAVGYLDPKNESKAQAGEKRIYARDPDTGDVVVEIWLKNDGEALAINANGSVKLRPDGGSVVTTPESTFDCAADGSITGQNANGAFSLETGGDFVVNGAKITTGGDVVSATGVSLNNHPHNQGSDSNGDTEQPTDAPTPTE